MHGRATNAARIADRASAALMSEAHGAKVARIVELSLEMLGVPGDCPLYATAVNRTVDADTPPFDTQAYETVYRESARDARWMATSLLTNSEREGDGSKRLWSLAACSDDPIEQSSLKQHAVDESKHSLMYLALLDLAFPGAVSPEFRIELRQLSPGFTLRKALYPVPGSPYAKKPTVDDFIQMNVAEIRTTIHHVMQRQALAQHCPPENRSAIKAVQDSLLRDELAHVGYTARLIERLAADLPQGRVADLIAKRFGDFGRITREELGDTGVFDCSLDCCEKRDWCRAKAPAFLDS
jgi:hypothetical protein